MAARIAIIPIFALPDIVLFPQAYLPLHIFEPRYRVMVRDAAATDGQIGLLAYDTSRGDDFDEANRLHDLGTLALMEHVQPLPDGRFNIHVRGLSRFRLLRLLPGKPYRLAEVELVKDRAGIGPDGAKEAVYALAQVFRYINPEYRKFTEGLLETRRIDHAFIAMVNTLISLLDLSFAERQALLELDSAAERLRELQDSLPPQLVHLRLMQEVLARKDWLDKQDPSAN